MTTEEALFGALAMTALVVAQLGQTSALSLRAGTAVVQTVASQLTLHNLSIAFVCADDPLERVCDHAADER
jgi:hypothetical protein